LDLIVWQAQATAAAEHLVKGQAVSFEPREYVTNAGDNRVAHELHGVDIEYGPRPRGEQSCGILRDADLSVDELRACLGLLRDGDQQRAQLAEAVEAQYEGTETMQTLIVGRDITGVGTFA
jgi:hypothetical protein